MPADWNPDAYHRVAQLQRWMAEKSLAGLALRGDERILDVGCGDGRMSAELAARVPRGAVLAVDASPAMIQFAARTFPATEHPTLEFRVADAAALPFTAEFDLVVSFNALHWVCDQAAALRGIAAALRPGGRTLLRFVPAGVRRSLEDVIEATRSAAPWSGAFAGFRTPFVHPGADDYRVLAARCGLTVERLDVVQEAWDFGSAEAFRLFADATFVEWTRVLAPEVRRAFIDDVLTRYARLGPPEQANVFTFYQMEAVLRR